MKISLLATTVLAASQLKQAGDPVNQSPSRSPDLPDKNQRLPASHLFPKRPTQFDRGMPETASSKTSAEHASQPAKPLLPPTPASNPMARYDYRKGDEATTLQEFRKALEGDFRVTSNKAAKDPEIFNKNPIMIYGEIHTDPKIPSLRTPKGVLLLESDDPNRCLPKHQLDSSNRCISIDTKKMSDQDMLQAITDCARKAKIIVDLIKPGAMSQIHAKVAASSNQATAVLQEALEFVGKSYDPAYSKCSSSQERSRLSEARGTFYDSIESFNQALLKSSGNREEAMLLECETAIRQLQTDASATIVVGDIHSKFLASQLSNKFPDRAVVLARDVNSPVA